MKQERVMQKPSVGRVVHYCATGKEPAVFPQCQHYDVFEKMTYNSDRPVKMNENDSFAALVTCTFIDRDDATITVFIPGGAQLSVRCPFAETPTPGHWSWPARV